MKINIRESLDFAVVCDLFLLKYAERLAKELRERQDLDDNLVVLLADVCNVVNGFHCFMEANVIPVLTNDLQIFGNTGFEKEVVVEDEE